MEEKSTFLVHIVGNEHSTWQGTITWVEKKRKEQFRSLLELIKLMDAANEGTKQEMGIK